MEAYQYARLIQQENGLGTIRLIKIKRGASGDNLCVAIKNFDLGDIAYSGTRNKYRFVWYALSYTWGELGDTERIVVEHGWDTGPAASSDEQMRFLTVTRQLTEALRHLRSTHEDRVLWIDAISIDQSNSAAALEERARQVRLMHLLYSQAYGVLMWIGSQSQDSEYAFKLLDDLGTPVDVDWTTFTIYTSTGDFPEEMKRWNDPKRGRGSTEHKAISALLQRPWFSRTWVRQEAILANENTSVIVCGMQWMFFSTFRKAMHCLSISKFDFDLVNVLTICERTYVDEPNLMNRIRRSQCRDARDKVYGNLGIMNTIGDSRFAASINVDYSSLNTTEQVYVDFFRRHHERYGTLRLLHEAGLQQSSGELPTWVPDWRNTFASLDLSMESATSHFAYAECLFLGDGVLQVLGCCAAKLCSTHMLIPKAENVTDMSWYQELASVILEHMTDTSDRAAERYTYALCSSLPGLRIDLDSVQQYREGINGYVKRLFASSTSHASDVDSPQDILDGPVKLALDLCIDYLKTTHLPFIFCEGGYVGIGPLGAQTGDLVTAILGSRALILLRKLATGSYEVVGPCYVHGLNWGEAILGPLPKNYTVVPRLDPSRGVYVPHYLNSETGLASLWDPRVDWRRLQPHPPMVNFHVIPAPEGEPLRIRPDSEYLRSNGMQLDRLLLV